MTQDECGPIEELQATRDFLLEGPSGSTLAPTTVYKEFCRDCGVELNDDDQDVRCPPCSTDESSKRLLLRTYRQGHIVLD